MLICNNQLNELQLQKLDNLSNLCHTTDGGVPPLYRHILAQKRISDNNVLYFEEDNLVGFLSVYFFYSNACEISVIVAPTHRRQGIAKQLIKAIMPLLIAKQVGTLIFSTPTVMKATWLKYFGYVYQNSEYHMQRISFEPILLTKHQLSIRKATEDDVPDLCAIDELCFPEAEDHMSARFDNLLNDSNYSVYIAFYGERAVGKAHIRWQTDDAVFSDIAISPRFQRQGLGSELLAYCINQGLTLGRTKLALDVETSNQNALKLYTRHGFKTTNANDFWAININKLRSFFESC